MKIKKVIFFALIFSTISFIAGCSKKHVLNEKYPEAVKALFIGVERSSLVGNFKKGSFTSFFKELFSTTEFQKHKQRVIEKVNELKGAFVETKIIADEVLQQYNKLPENKRIFDFYTLENVSFKTLPYLLDIPEGKVDRSFKKIRPDLKSNLILEIRPTKLIYNEKGDSKEFEVKIDIILFDIKTNSIIFRKTVQEDGDLKDSFYNENKLKKGEKPTPGFKKIKVSFNIENYKDGIRRLAKEIAPKIIKILKRPDKK